MLMKEEEKRLRIGVLIGNLETPHAYEVACGMAHACMEQNVNLVFYPAMFAKSYYADCMLATTEEYDYQNTAIFNYISRENCDALIISMGTVRFYLGLDDAGVVEFIKKFKDMPCIILEDHVPGYPCIILNNQKGLYDCFKHLIEKHKYRKIGYISGNRNNFDAQERLGVYLDVMEKYGLEHDESYIEYGEFTEYVDQIVGRLLNRHPDLDAIAFANDMMAIGGYREIKRRGQEIGKDIAVTGFDDYIMSSTVEPPLTTVRVSPYALGYRAVEQAVRCTRGEKVENSVIDSELVLRHSCGCDVKAEISEDETNRVQYLNHFADSKEIVNKILNNFSNPYVEEVLNEIIKKLIDNLDLAVKDQSDEINASYLEPIKELFGEEMIGYLKLEQVFNAMNEMMQSALMKTEEIRAKERILGAFYNIYAYITNHIANDFQTENVTYQKRFWYSTFITRDTMMYSADEAIALKQILIKLRDLQFKDAYIYLFREPKITYSSEDNIQNDELFLAAFFDENELVAFEEDERIPANEVFHHERFRSFGDRRISVRYNLYANEEQYGIISYNIDMSEFSFAYMISLQIGSALKFLNLMKTQMQMQKELEKSLHDISRKNDLLSQLSVKDELTGLFNRRGLFEKISETMQEKQGSMAAMMFIDMDNLKGVNDTFGHNEGDFALRSIADILKKSCREQDLIGRIGGDEYAVFCVVDEPGLMHRIHKKIQNLEEELNTSDDKPYYVEVSIGIKEFICKNGMNLNNIMKQADTALYEDKKNKRSSCVK